MKKNVFLIMLVLLFTSPVVAADYMIGEGDTLMISVWGEKDLTIPAVIVRPDGMISIPAVGEVPAWQPKATLCLSWRASLRVLSDAAPMKRSRPLLRPESHLTYLQFVSTIAA